jgi:tetratricopeptide (TPR) repeat protein
MCATQTEDLATERIAACARLLESGRLTGKPLGVAYGLRGLAFLDRSDVPHAIADFNRAIELAPDFAPAYQNRGNAWYARGNYGHAIADYDATIKLDPNSPSPYVNRAAVRRDLGYTDGALEDYQKAISLGADRATPYSGRGSTRAPAITCCAPRRAKPPATTTARCPTTRKPRSSIRKILPR